MKVFVAFLMLMISSSVFADSKSFEVDSQGCMFSNQHAACVVTNKFSSTISCRVTIDAKTSDGSKIGSSRTVIIQPKQFRTIEVFSREGNSIKSADAYGVCRVIS